MKKFIWVVAALAFLTVALLVFFREPGPPAPSPWLVLPDGSSNRIVAVTYGTNHIIGSPLGRLIARLPRPIEDELPTLAHFTDTPEPALVVWIEHQPTVAGVPPAPFSQRYERLSDGNGFVTGPPNSMLGSFGTVEISPVRFDVFPRRETNLTVNFYYQLPSGQVTNSGSLQYPNPLHETYPEWKAESLPAKKVTSEFELTLLGARADGDGAAVNFYVSPAAHGDTWQVAGIEVADATGNSVHNSSMNWSGNGGNLTISFQPALWPSEKVWKLRFEMVRTSGYPPETLLTFTNVPLGAAGSVSAPGWTTNFKGLTLALESIKRGQPSGNGVSRSMAMSEVKFTNSPLGAALRLDLANIAYDDASSNNSRGYGYSDTWRNYSVEFPTSATRADFTFAVQQKHIVEFTVQPDKPAAAAK